MKANENHISLEIAKLIDGKIKHCSKGERYSTINFGKYESYILNTWQEILWQYPQDFFGNNSKIIIDILILLQQKKYEEADKCFKENCILIN